ncbi:MAG TPA: stage II sporulation protein D [Clostridiales bacterium]|nr:stage II sporulation protein D [Clostridiales bacterium]HPV01678.1 stage II sporulation protein D [Clostridiales bacterium]
MKKIIYYTAVMVLIVILLPAIIVRSCAPEQAPPQEQQVEEIPQKPKENKENKEHKVYEITVYNKETGMAEVMDLEEYIMGVVAAEMPADFSLEALKAQAVAARTYAYGRMTGAYRSKQGVHDGIEICTDSTHCQAWVSRENAKKKWGMLFASRNWSKIEKAVNETKGLIMVYEGEIINALFHASSPGRTENAEDVWEGKSVPYLRSVESNDEASKGYITTVSISEEELAEKLLDAYPDAELPEKLAEGIKIIDLTEGGRVKTLNIGNITMKGTEFRSLLGLRSACFSIAAGDDGMISITTTGHGHGVGMSQWGANALAKTGGTFREILTHYYTGIDIVSISDFEDPSRKPGN